MAEGIDTNQDTSNVNAQPFTYFLPYPAIYAQPFSPLQTAYTPQFLPFSADGTNETCSDDAKANKPNNSYYYIPRNSYAVPSVPTYSSQPIPIAYPNPYSGVMNPPLGVVQPQYMMYPGYHVSNAPLQPFAPQMFYQQTPQPSFSVPSEGAQPFYGRTPEEVAADEATLRAATSADTKKASDALKPSAQPHDMFYVVSKDSASKVLMSFASIGYFTDGRWKLDADGTAYYWRGHPL